MTNYLAFFNFKDEPFRLTPDRDFFFPSANHTAMAEAIRFGLSQGEGFILCTGEVGTGKTMLLRMLMTDLNREFATAFLVSPLLTPKQLLLAILYDVGLGESVNTHHSLDHLIRVLNYYLVKLSETGKRMLVVIDEAQNLPDESIEQLRMLSNFETDKQKLLQIILVGQPELRLKIEKPHLRQLLQRVTIMETLNPLNEKEVSLYVNFRFNKAGRADIRLDHKSRRLLWRCTNGIPRLINKVMNRALLIGYARQQVPDARDIREAAESMHLGGKSIFARIPMPVWLIPVALMLAVMISVLLLKPAPMGTFLAGIW